jgi:hypothetical protein
MFPWEKFASRDPFTGIIFWTCPVMPQVFRRQAKSPAWFRLAVICEVSNPLADHTPMTAT